jgi:hypothetical protein
MIPPALRRVEIQLRPKLYAQDETELNATKRLKLKHHTA